ncbi:hypothetical protein D0864_06651 [Hortaea werneckii]|uniref:Centrosomin N-terminal motif 1 domain-containing protein n=1 Tax=Hortaea werneckii TaxID=91943 RepID=A0A3M7FHV2_HORWE|nr:hypothetical protein KC352_g26072 [Hortaea werneckii]KAI7639743.1 hypothetical protein KC319_g14286 [Hortaea werneckii]RMY88393.1 hypothetical protein D0864_06651 [Hortaea werneckii]
MNTGPGRYRDEVLPASQYLQERLSERRARNTRPKRSRHTDFGPNRAPDDDIFLEEAQESRQAATRWYDSSPLAPGSRHGSDAGGSAYGMRRSLGVKDMDGQMDRLNKQNFALKLELDHRREQQSKLQEQVDSMQEQFERSEQMQEEHAELLKINTQLVEELERRDRAVEEAMDIICDLEDRLAEFDERQSHTRPSTAHADSGYAGTETQEPAPKSSPPETRTVPKTPFQRRKGPLPTSAVSQNLQRMVNGKTPASTRREPSVFSLKKSSTHALRSVYLENAQNLYSVQSFNSLISKRDSRVEDGHAEEPNSPQLSVLSESSFPSFYSPQQQFGTEQYNWEAPQDADDVSMSGQTHYRQASINRVNEWISEGDAVEQDTPSKSNRISSPLSVHTDRTVQPLPRSTGSMNFQSLDDALSTASTSAAHLSRDHQLSSSSPRLSSHRAGKKRAMQTQLNQSGPQSITGPVFGDSLLPPTPDSASTNMLRPSSSSFGGERSLLDITPAAVKGYDALQPVPHLGARQIRSSAELHHARSDDRTLRNSIFGQPRDQASSAKMKDEYGCGSGSDDDQDAASDTLRDFVRSGDAFPDGNSITRGMPSRFIKRNRTLAANNIFFDGNDKSHVSAVQKPMLRRMKSNSDVTTSPTKPSLDRAETSPTSPGSRSQMDHTNHIGFKPAVDEKSQFSSSLGSYGVASADEVPAQTRARMSRSSASPAQNHRSLSQRTQQLFRRMSNSQSERSEPRSPRDKSPLPTLTSTPSSAYANSRPKQIRRPSNGDPKQGALNAAQRPNSSAAVLRPSLSGRTSTEPATGRSSSAANTPASLDRRTLFRRKGSAQKDANSVSQSIQSSTSDIPDQKSGSGGRISNATKRRGSLREAVSTRKPWR